MAPIRSGVHIMASDFSGAWQQGAVLEDMAHIQPSVQALLEQLAWWSKVLKAPREATVTAEPPSRVFFPLPQLLHGESKKAPSLPAAEASARRACLESGLTALDLTCRKCQQEPAATSRPMLQPEVIHSLSLIGPPERRTPVGECHDVAGVGPAVFTLVVCTVLQGVLPHGLQMHLE